MPFPASRSFLQPLAHDLASLPSLLQSSRLLFSLWPSCLPFIKTCERNARTQILNHICIVPLVVSGDMFIGSEDEDVDISVSGVILSFKMCSQKRLGRSQSIGEIFKEWN